MTAPVLEAPPRCGSCGRELRDPVSVAAGHGPVCRRNLYGPPPKPDRPARTPRRRSATALQEELPMPEPTPDAEMIAAAERLEDDHGIDGHIDSNSSELLDMIRVLLRTRMPLALLLRETADSVRQDGGVVEDATTEAVLELARAVSAPPQPGHGLGGPIVDQLLGGTR